jgi:DNA-binding NtrC family response regulator
MYRHMFSLFLTENGYDVTVAANGVRGLDYLRNSQYFIVFADAHMPDMSGIEFLDKALRISPQSHIVLITAFASIETAVEAIKLGALDYINKPAPTDKLLALIEKIKQRDRRSARFEDELSSMTFEGTSLNIIGKSGKIQSIFEIIRKIAPTESTVLITGESGTGKELVAKAIHLSSRRSEKPFFTMDCSTLVESLFESELFGHVKGSFTGATATKHGAFELAHGGTFFFDEIGNISLNVQSKILRAIQEKEIRRVGGTQTIQVDVRVIAATNLDLQQAVDQGKFRDDLYYRLSVIPINLPPLRERKEDIPLLIHHFIGQYAKKRRSSVVEGVAESTMELLMNYSWPGNIRELQNVIERALVIEEKSKVYPESLPQNVRHFIDHQETQLSLAAAEKKHIERILTLTQNNISQAARILEIDRKTLYQKMKRYRIRP